MAKDTNNPGTQSNLMAAKAEEERHKEGRTQRVFLIKDGAYVTYANPEASRVSGRGKVVLTTDEKEAFDYVLVEAAQAEIARMTKQLKNAQVVLQPIVQKKAEERKEELLSNASVPDEKKAKRKCFSSDVRRMVYRKTEGHCYLCGDFVDYEDYEIEHRVPLAKGGSNDLSNLFCSCHKCNAMKGSIAPEDLMERITKIYRHHIRTACGNDHVKLTAIEAALAMIE